MKALRAVSRWGTILLLGLSLFASGVPSAYAAPTVAEATPTVAVTTDEAAPGRIAPLRDVRGLASPKEERTLHLTNAHVVLADYELIKHDFREPLEKRFAKPIAAIANDEIDTWVIDSAANISEGQARQTQVNTAIPHSDKSVKALRPRDYGRALVFEPAPGVFIDVKGAGAKSPTQEDHSNGLATLGESIREYAYEHLVHEVFQHSGTGVRTVGHYAVLDAGFDVKQPDGRIDPAGLILRQPHSRAEGVLSALNDRDTTRDEAILRQYGITSAGAYQKKPYDKINLQGTRDGAVLDFGGFLVMPKFEKPAYHFDRAPDTSSNSRPLLDSGKVFPQPDEKLRVPFNLWGYPEAEGPDPIHDYPTKWSHELATSLRQGRATRADAERHMHNLLDPVRSRLSANPPLPSPVAAVSDAAAPSARKNSTPASPSKPQVTVSVFGPSPSVTHAPPILTQKQPRTSALSALGSTHSMGAPIVRHPISPVTAPQASHVH